MKLRDIKLGQTYKHKLHAGIEGIATARIEYLTGCDQVCLESVHDGSIVCHWIDITNLANVKVPAKARKPGGPPPSIPSRHP